MNKSLLQLILLFVVTIINAQDYKFLGEYTSNGTPLYLEEVRDDVSVETQEMISNALPESFPVPDYNPHYISSGYDTDVNLNDTADVWVTFVDEGAGYRNVLGFYTYPIGNPPATRPSKDEITIIFPNVSALGSGGGLITGDKVKIGTFDEGTAIGWVLLANAWRNGSVGNAYWDVFSNPIYNPEPSVELRHHNVLLEDPDHERIILGFEDIRRDYRSCDNDFNDAIFYVTASPYEAIVTTNYVNVDEATPNVSSSNTAGLESNGKLASLIAKRNFTRDKTNSKADQKSQQKIFNKKQRKASNEVTTQLEQFLPETGMFQTEVAQISSPEDLLGVTNATEIFAIDMYDGENRVSAALATATTGSVYDHSKAICDRLNHSSLEDVRPVTVRGHRIISSKIIRNEGQIEYTLTFSVKLGETSNEVLSFWNIDQYPSGDYYNFQIWGTTFSQVFSIANHIFDSLAAEKELISSDVSDRTPLVFVKSGTYKNGKVELDIVNKARATEMIFSANISETEVSETSAMQKTVALTGAWNQKVIIETGNLFDVGLSIETAASSQKDALYLADGPWGADYNSEIDAITAFDVTISDVIQKNGEHLVERNIDVEGELKGTINVFRHLMPGDQLLDVSEFDAIEFEVESSHAIEVILMTDDIADWSKRLRKTIAPSYEKEKVMISFNDFVDNEGNTIDLKTVRTLVFSVQGDYVNKVDFTVKVENVKLVEPKVASVTGTDDIENEVSRNYPNPFIGKTVIEIPRDSRTAAIKVFDMMGRLVDSKSLPTKDGNEFYYQSKSNMKGVYSYQVIDDNQYVHKGSFMIR
ncbi:DUF4114 domain-containing protein [Flavicella sp.]|uniref:DUF4114 domain-containing protein n=1 Tax=Flavicella sp. TaxID=2957742 RepID=UPI00262BD5DD|nr:DUF4114 domain-containing protein [Flavicella sp.]MDG1805385.1 DUF4114 domain-containing protein [Flavicella sp.]